MNTKNNGTTNSGYTLKQIKNLISKKEHGEDVERLYIFMQQLAEICYEHLKEQTNTASS